MILKQDNDTAPISLKTIIYDFWDMFKRVYLALFLILFYGVGLIAPLMLLIAVLCYLFS